MQRAIRTERVRRPKPEAGAGGVVARRRGDAVLVRPACSKTRTGLVEPGRPSIGAGGALCEVASDA